jgi:hypothetical protein|tara:strand:+ start:1041 stop:1646 length:606 start_codon:yes stop_codon:yes gene_type:complete
MAKKNNKVAKIKGAKKFVSAKLKDQQAFDAKCEYAISYSKGTKWNQDPELTYRYMACKLCGQTSSVGHNTQTVVCSHCVNTMVEAPTMLSQKIVTGRPAGWHWKAVFVDLDGKVYHRGVEQVKLKGTLEPTKIEPKKRIRKKDKQKVFQEAILRISKLKKQLKSARFKKDQKPIEAKLKKLQKIAQGKFPKNFIISEFMAE